MSGGRARRRRVPRDQEESPFALILQDFLALAPFARGAAIVDFEGETVDYAGDIDPFELRVAGATLQLTLADVRGCPQLGSAFQVSMRLGRAGYVLRLLDPHYTLLIIVRKLGTFVISARVLHEIEARILAEAHLPIVRKPTAFRVEVDTTGRGSRLRPARVRPARLSGAEGDALEWMPVEVLGAVVTVGAGERAFRVRLPTGAELTLLRDNARFWFAEERIEALMRDARGALPAPRQP